MDSQPQSLQNRQDSHYHVTLFGERKRKETGRRKGRKEKGRDGRERE